MCGRDIRECDVCGVWMSSANYVRYVRTCAVSEGNVTVSRKEIRGGTNTRVADVRCVEGRRPTQTCLGIRGAARRGTPEVGQALTKADLPQIENGMEVMEEVWQW